MSTHESVYVNERTNTDLVQFVATAGGKLMLWVHGTTVDGEPEGVKTLLTREDWEAVKQAGDTVMKRMEDEG